MTLTTLDNARRYSPDVSEAALDFASLLIASRTRVNGVVPPAVAEATAITACLLEETPEDEVVELPTMVEVMIYPWTPGMVETDGTR